MAVLMIMFYNGCNFIIISSKFRRLHGQPGSCMSRRSLCAQGSSCIQGYLSWTGNRHVKKWFLAYFKMVQWRQKCLVTCHWPQADRGWGGPCSWSGSTWGSPVFRTHSSGQGRWGEWSQWCWGRSWSPWPQARRRDQHFLNEELIIDISDMWCCVTFEGADIVAPEPGLLSQGNVAGVQIQRHLGHFSVSLKLNWSNTIIYRWFL